MVMAPCSAFIHFHTAKLEGEPHLSVWGTGTPRRDSDVGLVKISSGEEITISLDSLRKW
jgi:hypothetical protein